MADPTADDILQGLMAKKGSPPVIGGVVIHDTIGVGGMGAVFRGSHLRLRIPVAVKFLFPQQGQDFGRLQDEAAFTARVNHPNVVRVFDVGEEDGFCFIVQEYVQGRSASRYFHEAQRGTPLSEDFVLGLGADVARGLAAIHTEHLLHLDIKPSNVLIADKDGIAKILDLGVAQHYDPETVDTREIKSGPQVVFGTPGYVSPEHLLGQNAGPASDIYSLGVTMYELLLGKYAIPTENWVAPASLQAIDELADLRTLRPDVSAATARLIHRCVRVSAKKRFQSATELLSALVEVIEQRSIEGPRPKLRRSVSLRAPRVAEPLAFCVDDDTVLCGILEEILTEAGCRVRTFTDGAQALEAAEQTQPDVFVLDMEMPGLSGLDVCRALRARESCRHTPVVFLTGATGLDKMNLALHEGATDYLFKPVQPRELVARVMCLTRISQAQREFEQLQQQYGRFRSRLRKLSGRRLP
jgi:serine/threonine protein kinase